jgi:FolB domain-containing protein
MDKITLCDLEVCYQVGVTEEERSRPQRLVITVEMALDFSAAQSSDNLADTIDYAAITERLLHFGDGCHWELIETLAGDIAAMILDEYSPLSVTVEVKKFIIPQARHVSVSLTRRKGAK